MSDNRHAGMPRAFLTAEWRNLVMLNYVVDPAMLVPFVPAGTVLDAWQGRTYVSLVGFLFANTRLRGIPIPCHRTFEEINLRFYVRREVEGEVRRAVTFLRELVPRAAIARIARLAYNEPYRVAPMRHLFEPSSETETPTSVYYGWRYGRRWNGISAERHGAGQYALAGSEEHFITEHYWGYTRQRDGSTVEYRVVHEPWRVWSVANPVIHGDWSHLYGEDLTRVIASPPVSAYIADGSAVTVYPPVRLTEHAPLRQAGG